MRTVYAVQFMVGRETEDSNEILKRVKKTVIEWVKSWYERRREVTVNIPDAAGSITPCNDHKIETSLQEAPSGESIWTLIWSYPDETDPNLTWNSECSLAFEKGLLEISIIIRISSNYFTVTPSSFDVRRPYLVKMLLDRFHCHFDTRQLSASPRIVSINSIPDLVTYLLSKNRRIPVVIFSLDPYSEQYPASPLRAADILAGLADVYALENKWVSYRLTDAIGKNYSCYNGAVRIYWPGVNASGTLRVDHPLLMEEVSEWGDQLGNRLLRRIAPASALRFIDSKTTRSARQAIETEQKNQHARIREQALAGTAQKELLEQDILKLLEDNSVLDERNKQVAIERDKAQLQVLELEHEVQQLRENLQVLSQYRPEAKSDSTSETEESEDPKTILEVLALANGNCDKLVIWNTAKASARDNDFDRPRDVYQALQAINDLAQKFFDARKTKKSIGSWEQFFERRGFKYAPLESQNTINMYGGDRDFSNDGKKYRIVKHLTLGKGDTRNCLQIYFDVDETNQKFIVAYCGRHLPYYGM